MSGPDEIRVSVSPGERRLALMRGGTLEEAAVERPARPEGIGDLHLGRVSALAPALSGRFVRLEDEDDGFLPDAQGGEGLAEGAPVVVLVSRAAQGGKGPRLTTRGAPGDVPREGAPRRLARGPEEALRLAAAHPGAPLLCDDPAETARLRATLGRERVRLLSGPAFDEALEEAFERLAGREVPLPGGARLSLHPTPALVALDVDSGGASGRGALRAVNAAAVAEAARQIRLRRLAGPILLDPAGGTPAEREALLPLLRAAAAPDPLLRVLGTTRLGLLEMVRARVRAPLHEVLGDPPSPLTRGLATLRRAAREASARPGARLALRAHPAVLSALSGLPGALEDYAARAAHPICLRPDPALGPGGEAVEEAREP